MTILTVRGERVEKLLTLAGNSRAVWGHCRWGENNAWFQISKRRAGERLEKLVCHFERGRAMSISKQIAFLQIRLKCSFVNQETHLFPGGKKARHSYIAIEWLSFQDKVLGTNNFNIGYTKANESVHCLKIRLHSRRITLRIRKSTQRRMRVI